LARCMVFQPDIGEIKVMNQAELINSDMKLAVA